MDGPFHGQNPLVCLLRPHYPRWRGCQGICGHSPYGERAVSVQLSSGRRCPPWCSKSIISDQSVLNCLNSFRGRNLVPLKQFQRLLGHMASAVTVTPLRLLHMRPLQHWSHSRVPRWLLRHGAIRMNIRQEFHRSFSPWTDLAFLRARVPLEQVSRHVAVTKYASSMDWGAACNMQLKSLPTVHIPGELNRAAVALS